MKSIKKISFIILLAIFLSMFLFNFAVNAAEGDKPNPSGAYIKYTVNIKKKEDGPTLAYCINNFKKIDYVIQDGDLLEYDVTILIDEAGWGHVDGSLTGADSNILRAMPLTDADGTTIHPLGNLTFNAYGSWYHRVVDLSDIAGAKWGTFQLAMHPDTPELEYSGVVLYDNIVITNNGEVKLVIFKDAEDFPVDSKFTASPSQSAKATVELLIFTDEEIQAFKDAEEAKIKEQESKEASKAEASKEASREQARIDASIEASIEEANRTEPINEPTNSASASNGGDGMNIGLIIGIAAGVVVVVVIIVLIVSGGKKKGGKK